MSKTAPVNPTSTPGSISRRSGRTSRPLEEGIGARSSSAGGADANGEGNGGMSVTTPRNAITVPPSAAPWRHPDELPFVLREDWTQELMIDYLAKKSFTVPPNSYRSKDPFFTITPRNGQLVVIPRRYRIPILFLAKFQWDSIRIVLTASDPATDWNICKYEIIHISRVCQHFFDAARGAAEMKGPGALSRTWRCPLIDRVLVRFWNHWFLSEESWLKAFYKEFGEEDYEQDILEKDWQRWAVKGHKGFQLTKEETTDGITADQFMDGLTKTYSGWTWVVSTPSEPEETSAQGPDPNETPAQAPDGDQGSSSSSSTSITAVPTAPETPKLTQEHLEQMVQSASGSSGIIPPMASPLALKPPSQVISTAVPEPSTSQVTPKAEIPKTTPSVVPPVPAVMREEVSDANVGNKRARDDTDVDIDKQRKKAKKKSNSPELPPPSPAVSTVTRGSTLPTEPKALAVHQSQSSRELSSSVGPNDGEASARQTVNSATVPASAIASATVGQQEPSRAPIASTVLPGARKRAHSVESTDSSLSNLSSSSRSVSSTPPPQSLPITISMQSASANGVPTKVATPVPLPKSATPTVPGNAAPVSVHTPLPIATIPPFLPEDLGPEPIDRDMSVSPIVRSAASSSARSAITGTVPGHLPDTQFESNGAAATSDGGSQGSTASLSGRSVPTDRMLLHTGAPSPMYQTQHASAQSYHSYLSNSSTIPSSFMPSQTMTTDGMLTSFHPFPTLFRNPALAASSPVPAYSKPPSVPGQEQYSNHSILLPALQNSPPLPPSNDGRNAPLTGPDMNLMNLTDSPNRSSFSTMSAFAQAGLPDPHEKTQKLHASLLVRDLLDFMRTSSWKRHQSGVQGERGPVVDARTRHLVLDGDHAMSVDQRFVILKNSVLAIINRFDGMKADQLEKEIEDVDSKLKHIFDETWTALNLPCREEWPFKRTTVDAEVQVTPVDVVSPKALVRDASVQASVEPIRQLLESVSIQTENTASDTAAPLLRPSVSPDATMVDLTGSTKNDKTAENDISVKAAMASIMDMMHDFLESSKSHNGKEREDSAESSVLATVMAEFKAMKDDLKKAQQMNREELQALNELHRNEVKALEKELRHREQQRKAELDALKSQHRAEVETLRGTIQTMEKERERLAASEDEATRVQPQELLDLRRRITTLESLPRSPGFASDHVMASPPLSAASTTRSEPLAAVPKMQAHPLSHLISIDGDDTPMPFSPRTLMASMREASASKPGTPLSSERTSVSRRDSMDVADEPNIPMPVKTQRKPYMFAPRPSAG